MISMSSLQTQIKHEISPTKCSLPNKISRLQTLKRDIINQGILTSRKMAQNFNRITKTEQTKFLLNNRYMASTLEWQKTMIDTIQIRRLHIIEQASFIINHKLLT